MSTDSPATQPPRDAAPGSPGAAGTPQPAPEAVPSLLDDPQVRRWGPLVALILLAFIFLFPSIRGMYIWDDPAWLTKNTTIQSGSMGLWKVWSDPSTTPHYYPLVFTTYWLEFRQWGLGTQGTDGIIRGVGYHIDNLLLHIAAVLLLFTLLKALKLPGGKAGAWIASALWAIHPMTVESVAWVAERKNVLSAVFFWATLYCGLKFFRVIQPESATDASAAPADKSAPAPHWGLYAATLALFTCTMLSKTAACFAPPALLVLIWWKRGRITPREILLTLPLFALAIGFGAFTAYLENNGVGAQGPEFAFSAPQRIAIAGNAVFFYLGKLFVPSPVMQIYPRWDIVAGTPISNHLLYLAPVGVPLIGIALFLLRKHITRGPLAAYLFFVGGLFPVMGFINYYTMIYTFVADHYQYLAGAAIIVLSVEVGLWLLRTIAAQVPVQKGFDRAAEQARFFRITAGLLFGGLTLSAGALAFGAASLYQDSRQLWADNARYNNSRGAFGVWHNLADAYSLDFKDYPHAMQAYQKAVTYFPDWNSYHSLALLDLEIDNQLRAAGTQPAPSTQPTTDWLQEALANFKEADRLMPPFVREGRKAVIERQAQSFDAGLATAGSLVYGTNALVGQHLMDQEQYDPAIPWFYKDLEENPNNPADLFRLAQCYQGKGDYPSALTFYRQAVAANPKFLQAWLGLALVDGEFHFEPERRNALLRAHALDPDHLAGLIDMINHPPRGMIGPPPPLPPPTTKPAPPTPSP